MNDHPARPEVVLHDAGGWISGPCLPVSAEVPKRAGLAMLRLIAATETWSIRYRPELRCWSAERMVGSAIVYVAATSTTALADGIEAAERKWLAV